MTPDLKRKSLIKIHLNTKHNQLYRALLAEFKESRLNGHTVDFQWLWSKPHNIE